jgi:menaquinone-9 beta-reductase
VVVQREKADVFVVGGGPAGLAAAIAVRQKGFSVTLADGSEPPIDKPCGEGMMPETQVALRGLEIELPAGAGYRFRGIQFVQHGLRLAADFPAGYGLGIRRPILHESLVQKAERSGVKLLWKTPVVGIGPEGVQLSGRFVPARWILGADGGRSRIRKWSGLEAACWRTQRSATRRHYRIRPWGEYVEIHWGRRAQAYVTPISSEEVCIVVIAEKTEEADFDRALEDLPELQERLVGAELASRERGAITTMHTLRRVTRGNVTLLGDASGCVDAITGEGLRLAFRQSLALAEAMEYGQLARYERAHREISLRPARMGKLMLLLARNAALRARVFRALAARPEIFERLLSIYLGRSTPADIVLTSASLGWQFLAV